MIRGVVFISIAIALVALSVFAPISTPTASACSLAPMTLDQIAEAAPIVIVGDVIMERTIGGPYAAYESTVRVAATLKGAAPHEITFSPLGYLGADCSGGPRLAAQERVLLFIWKGPPRADGAETFRIVSYTNGKYVLAGGEARHMHQEPMAVEDALRRVGTITEADPTQLAAAISFAIGEPTPPAPQPETESAPIEVTEENGSNTIFIGLASAVGAIVLLAAIFGLRQRRRGM